MKALRHEAEALNKTGVTIREADPGDAVAGVPLAGWHCPRPPRRSPR